MMDSLLISFCFKIGCYYEAVPLRQWQEMHLQAQAAPSPRVQRIPVLYKWREGVLLTHG